MKGIIGHARRAGWVATNVLGAVSALASGAAAFAGPVDPVPATAPIAASVLTLVDARPDDEKKTHILTNSVFSCEFGVIAFADDVASHLKPKLDHLDRLERLKAALPVDLAAHEVAVTHYGLYFDNSSSMTGAVIAGPLGAIGNQTLKPRCAQDKMPFGWFDPAEATTGRSPFVVQMELSVDGRPIVLRSVYSPQKGEPIGQSIVAALDKADVAATAALAGAGPPR